MFCSISGQAPEDPVISSKSGHLFERRLIEKAIQSTGRCPLTNEPLSVEDLISVKTTATASVKPRPVQATSIPGLLSIFQNEWDSLMLETFTLKQHLETVRQELSHALYQHDAACRVIARLVKERDEARAALGQAQGGSHVAAQSAAPAAAASMDTDQQGGINENIIAQITELSKSLSSQRRKRAVPPGLVTPSEIEQFHMVSSHPLHKASQPGVTCIDVHRSVDLIVTGGVDAQAVLFNVSTGKVTGTLQGHSKRINDVCFVPNRDLLVTGSSDRTARVWGADTRVAASVTHQGEVQSVTVHPSGNFFVSGCADGSWSFHDLATGLTRARVPVNASAVTVSRFHPDGLILGTGGADSVVRVWDIKTQQNVASFEGHGGAVTSLAFSENGYYLATAAESEVKLWDLRKLQNVKTLPMDSAVASVAFDFSGNYLAIGGADIRIVQVKTWNSLKTLSDHTATVTGVCFGADGKFLASSSMDRSMKVFSVPSQGDNME